MIFWCVFCYVMANAYNNMMKKTGIAKQTNPIDTKEKVQKSNDEHIDQDFEGYPHNPAREEVINPQTKEERLTAKTEEQGNITTAQKE